MELREKKEEEEKPVCPMDKGNSREGGNRPGFVEHFPLWMRTICGHSGTRPMSLAGRKKWATHHRVSRECRVPART